MAILTSKEYVDAKAAGSALECFTASASGEATNVDISTASTTPVQASLGTFGNYAAIDSAKSYLVFREFYCRISGTATAASDITIEVTMTDGRSELAANVNKIATRIPSGTAAEFMKMVGNDAMIMTGAEIKSQPVKAIISTSTNVAGATVTVNGGISYRLFEITETDLDS